MIILSKPCKEDWNQMNLVEKGRFCDKCTKVITDFSGMTKDEVMAELKARKGQEICGRFHRNHLATKAEADKALRSARKMKRYRLFIAAIFIVFGTSLFTSCGKDLPNGKQVKIENHMKKPAEKGFLDPAFLPMSQNGFIIPPPQEIVDSVIGIDPDDIIQVAGVEPVDYIFPDTTSH